jgi:glycosyltransferase involved in cell wall biosynthesis
MTAAQCALVEGKAVRLEAITPVILTFNEEPNIGRVLSRLAWAADVVVVDSHSTDRTREIASGFPNVRILSRSFDSHAAQWDYAIRETGIASDWILTLDSDYVLSDRFVHELEDLAVEAGVAGYEAPFRYCVWGRRLPRSIYPPRVVLCRRDRARFIQDGHTQRLVVEGDVRRLHSPIDHDDRKPLSHWIVAQDRYARLERDKLLSTAKGTLGGADRLRRFYVVAPIAVLIYCLFFKGLIFKGFAGWHYTYQRVLAELVLALYLIEDRLLKKHPP